MEKLTHDQINNVLHLQHEIINKYLNLKKGQAFFIALSRMFPIHAEILNGTKYDIFHIGDETNKCINYLMNGEIVELEKDNDIEKTDVVVDVMKCLIPEINKLDITDKKKEMLQCNLQQQLYDAKECNDDNNLALGLSKHIWFRFFKGDTMVTTLRNLKNDLSSQSSNRDREYMMALMEDAVNDASLEVYYS